ncbi:hypothetical protein NY590_01575, partial [Enterobacter kobei]|uniref:hypothetical protein n=1 Tax=Enterobacter kobei TaxID=208224 RepID=UPI0022F0FA92
SSTIANAGRESTGVDSGIAISVSAIGLASYLIQILSNSLMTISIRYVKYSSEKITQFHP